MLFPLLDYEMRAAERYGRFVSVVMITTKEELPRVRQLLSNSIRKSDVLSDFDSSLVVMMGETDKNDALCAIKRYMSFFLNQLDLRFSVATYPEDGIRPDTLIDTAYKRLNKARQATAGTVVAAD